MVKAADTANPDKVKFWDSFSVLNMFEVLECAGNNLRNQKHERCVSCLWVLGWGFA